MVGNGPGSPSGAALLCSVGSGDGPRHLSRCQGDQPCQSAHGRGGGGIHGFQPDVLVCQWLRQQRQSGGGSGLVVFLDDAPPGPCGAVHGSIRASGHALGPGHDLEDQWTGPLGPGWFNGGSSGLSATFLACSSYWWHHYRLRVASLRRMVVLPQLATVWRSPGSQHLRGHRRCSPSATHSAATLGRASRFHHVLLGLLWGHESAGGAVAVRCLQYSGRFGHRRSGSHDLARDGLPAMEIRAVGSVTHCSGLADHRVRFSHPLDADDHRHAGAAHVLGYGSYLSSDHLGADQSCAQALALGSHHVGDRGCFLCCHGDALYDHQPGLR